ncbi:MAG: hypothetical protein VR64_10640 [Desulfatitalea sp. BRH_c12]|nr:MAG: hypothetical protein VR64_10640 [Desulfatitalea sp. BRH_c12]
MLYEDFIYPADANKSREQLLQELAVLRANRQSGSEAGAALRGITWETLKTFETIYRNAPVGLCVLDTDLRYVRVNDRLAAMTGLAVEAHIGRTVAEIVPDLSAVAEPMMRQVIQTSLPVLGVEATGRTAAEPDILRTWVSNWEPLKNAAGTVVGLNGVILEITAQKRAEENLRQRTAVLEGINRLFQKALTCRTEEELSTVCLRVAQAVTSSAFGFIAELNDQNRLNDLRISDAGLAVCRIASPGDRHGVTDGFPIYGLYGQVVREGKGFYTNTPDAHPAYVGLPPNHPPLLSFLGMPLVHDDTVVGVVALANRPGGYGAKDLEALEMLAPAIVQVFLNQRAEARSRAAEARYRRIIETADEGIWIIDHEHKTLFANTKMAAMLGCSVEALSEGSLFDFMDAQGQSLARQYIERRRTGIAEQHDFKFKRKDGSDLWALISTNPIFDDSGRYQGALAMLTDITDRKKMEQSLRELTESLEQRVAERTELVKARSKQLQALAVELIAAEEQERQRIADFLHDDLQQILASARIQVQLAAENLSFEPMLVNVERMLAESIAKSRRLSHDLSPVVLNHSGLIAALQWLFRQMFEQFGLNVQFELGAERPFESAPLKIFLFRAVQELLFNIVKHAGVKSARVALSTTTTSLIVTVSDVGRGFDPDFLDTFTPSPGLGLLSLRERASYIGGRLAIESAAGRGSRFTLTVPLKLVNAAEPQGHDAAAHPRPMLAEPALSEEIGPIRVIFADDHKVMRKGLIMLIAAQPDIQVVGEASNGREALDLARQLRPDVVVMDVSMPVMDGIEATRRIKAEVPDVRVIGLSMYEDDQLARTMHLAGAETFVSKSASSAKLLKALYGTTGSRQAAR